MNGLRLAAYGGALTLSVVAAYFSILGLTAIFTAAFWPIVIMGVTMELGKVITTAWLYRYWKQSSVWLRTYLLVATILLCLITSMGIFGFLSKAHTDRSLVGGDTNALLAVYDENIKTAKDNIDVNRRALKQMDEAVDQVMARSTTETGAEKAVQIRKSQSKERVRLLQEIETEQKKIGKINEERAPIAAQNRKIEAEVGPIKYIAKLIYGDNPDSNLLEKAVTWVILILVIVFDPLALALLLAANSMKTERKPLKYKQNRNTIHLGRDAIMNMQLEKT